MLEIKTRSIYRNSGRISAMIGGAALTTGGLISSQADAQEERPNILWLTSEDNNITFIGCYGNEYAHTPNIDKLATEGFRFTHCYSNGAVCSASRSAWITGMLSPSTGLLNHRCRLRIPKEVKLYPAVLRDAGYYTANCRKTDYNILNVPSKLWDSNRADWKTLKKKQPFFQVINYLDSHESRAMSTRYSTQDPAKVKLPPYHPDTPGIRANYASYYESVTKMDAKIGKALKELEEAGLADDTIVIYNSDHGGPLPRGKRFMYDSGTHCPLIIRIPEKFKKYWPADKPNSTVDRLVGFVDMIPTWISLAGGKIPSNYQGRIFLGPNTQPEPEFNYSFRGRNDERIENARAIRDKRYLYVKNFIPYVPRGQHLAYQWKIPIQRFWEKCYKEGKTNSIQSRYFKLKHKEELYDTAKDPYCINNLIDNPEYKGIAEKLSKALNETQAKIYDAGFLPESDLDRIARDNKITVYELLRNKKFYDTEKYIQCADTALDENPDNLQALTDDLSSPDMAIRYWGAVGLMMLGADAAPAKDALLKCLQDDSHNVRLMASWALIKIGDKEPGYKCITDMIKSNSYAMLEILNVIDWMGDAKQPLIPVIAAMPPKSSPCIDKYNNKYIPFIRKFLLRGEHSLKERKRKTAHNKNKKTKTNKKHIP